MRRVHTISQRENVSQFEDAYGTNAKTNHINIHSSEIDLFTSGQTLPLSKLGNKSNSDLTNLFVIMLTFVAMNKLSIKTKCAINHLLWT